MTRQLSSPTNSSAAVISGHTHLWRDSQTRNYTYKQRNIDPCVSTHHSPIPLQEEKEKDNQPVKKYLHTTQAIRYKALNLQQRQFTSSFWFAGKKESRWWVGNSRSKKNMGITCYTTATSHRASVSLIKTLVFCTLYHQEYGGKWPWKYILMALFVENVDLKKNVFSSRDLQKLRPGHATLLHVTNVNCWNKTTCISSEKSKTRINDFSCTIMKEI